MAPVSANMPPPNQTQACTQANRLYAAAAAAAGRVHTHMRPDNADGHCEPSCRRKHCADTGQTPAAPAPPVDPSPQSCVCKAPHRCVAARTQYEHTTPSHLSHRCTHQARGWGPQDRGPLQRDDGTVILAQSSRCWMQQGQQAAPHSRSGWLIAVFNLFQRRPCGLTLRGAWMMVGMGR